MVRQTGLGFRRRALCVCGAAVFAVPSARAADADKSGYTLFDPTPLHLMREMSADRPDVTESPYTVDAGHLQIEMSLIDFAYDKQGETRTRTFTAAPINLKLGLLNNADLQLVLNPYVRTRVDNNVSETFDGFGDTQLRLKINLWGNDGASSAFGLMPYIKLPTGASQLTNNHLEGGLILPFAISLPGDVDFGLMGQFDVLYDDEDDDYTAEFIHTVAVGGQIIGRLGGYVEYIGVAPLEGGRYQVLLGTGFTYAIREDVQLDAGMIVGLTDQADDLNVFTGITFRY